MKVVLYSISGFIIVLVLVFMLSCFGLVSYRFFAPIYKNTKREVFENTQSFVEGKRQSLTKYYNEWRKSNKVEKASIRMIVLQEFAHFDTNLFTVKQLDWYNEIVG